jgi:DNA polymerase-3 subunit epsilon
VKAPLCCLVDVETTGTRPVEKYGVIQIAGVICVPENGALREIDSFNFRCAPHAGDLISKEALAVNGTTIEQLRTYPSPLEVHAHLTQQLARHVRKFDKTDKMFLVGYNGGFDADHLRAWFDKAGDKYFGSWFWTPCIDVMTMAALRLADRRSSMPNFKLTTVAEALGVAPFEAHDALADVRATKSIYEICSRAA